MKIDSYPDLNPVQREAVKTIHGPLLIIAGAGSGKTRVITYRIAHMLSKGISQKSILALTFTNKAAKEMSERIHQVTGLPLKQLTVSTFHAFGVKVLRKTIRGLGYKENFAIYDSVDKMSLVKQVSRELGHPVAGTDFYTLCQIFSDIKTERTDQETLDTHTRQLYEEYQSHLKLYNAVDFDDLIVLPLVLLESRPAILEEYRGIYTYILIDEFQDSSAIQYRLVSLLAGIHRNICAVGDDDQSIYSWRGANYGNILSFEKDFSERIELKLEQNYRSNRTILEAANGLIANNTNRKDKNLWTGSHENRTINIHYPEDEEGEGGFIVSTLLSLKRDLRIKYAQFGILVRTNSLVRPLEDALISRSVPVSVTGGASFFQRKEVKDILSYLRIFLNPDDDINLLRVINTPRRGIGKKTLTHVKEVADSKSISLFSAMTFLIESHDQGRGEKPAEGLKEIVSLVREYEEQAASGKGLGKKISLLVDRLDYWSYLLAEHPDNDKLATYKYGNIKSLIDIFDRWEKDPDNYGLSLYDYLNRISLLSRDEQTDADMQGKVNLMTIHAAKGLEFNVVFIAGVEDGIIPHARSLEEDEANIEEERRLFYVALTRAKQFLYLTSCRTRKTLGKLRDCLPSPFLAELPAHTLEVVMDEDVDDGAGADYFSKMREMFGQ